MNRNNLKFWQRIAWLYSAFMKNYDSMYDEIAAHIRKYLGKDMHVLELGCGTGQITFRLADNCALWEATDFSEKMIEKAKQKNSPFSLKFSVQDATNLSSYGDNSFDAVVISNALHIMPDPECALKEITRVLKPHAYLFAPTFIRNEKFSYKVRIKIMNIYGFKTYNNWNKDELLSFIYQHGFKIKNYAAFGKNISPLCSVVAIKKE